MASQRPAEKGSLIEVTIDSLAYGGRGVGRCEGMAAFVDRVAPGERVRARVVTRKKSHAEAELVEVILASTARREPPCPLFGDCGGCSWQHLDYAGQLEAKRRIVRDSVERIGGLSDVEVRPAVESPREFRYRNKMEFSFGTDAAGRVVVGFHRSGEWRTILDVRRCWLHPEAFDAALRTATEWAALVGATAYNPVDHVGYLRHWVLRTSEATGGVVAVLLTSEERDIGVESLWQGLRANVPGIQGLVWGLNRGLADVARADAVLGQWGDTTLRERLGALEFQMSPSSFFQTNTLGAERLYETTRAALGLEGREVLLDAYCGTGTIGLFCAPQCREVWGIEIVREAVWDARQNAARNEIGNARFLAGDMKRTLPKLIDAAVNRFDRVVVDPPRAGMEKKALRQLLDLSAPVLVYVSCNPTTLGRDLQAMVESGYEVEYVVPVDMFPQTFHVEAVARCRKKSS